MPYIGTSPSNGVRRVYTYTATASQTNFSGPSNEGSTLAYVDNNYLDVYQNGILLGSADYTSTNGTSVDLVQAASVDDIIVIVAYDVFSVADTVSKTDGGTFDSAVTMANNLTVNGAFTSQGIDDNADANAITIDSSERVGIKSTSPTNALQVVGTVKASSQLYVGSDSDDNYSGGIENLSNSSRSIGIKADPTNSGSGSIINFTIDGTEHMRIDANGNVIIGATALNTVESIELQYNGIIESNKSSSAGTVHMRFNNGGSNIGSITSNTTTTFFNTSSDYRLKENVVEMADATTRLKQLQPKRFNFIADADTTVDGFLAHEVSSVVPEAITGTHNEVDDDNNPVYQGIDQSKLVPLLVKTIQELEARITALENAE